MPLYHIILLALIQGITEFIPVSSSGHLVLTHALMGEGKADLCWETNRLMDVAVHVGTLLAVLIYFRKDLWVMIQSIIKPRSEGFKLDLYIIIASLPVLIGGLVLQMIKPSFLCVIEIMAWTTLIFGIVLYFADKTENQKTLNEMTWKNALCIGLSQMLALIPGVSRSGITMTSARFLGFSRIEAARFSLLLSVIAISGAGFLTSVALIERGDMTFGLDIFMAVSLSFIAGYTAIALMMNWLKKSTFMPFVIYRIGLGIILLGLIYSGLI